MITALIIDDEPLAREEMCLLLAETEMVEVLGQANNAIEGMKKLQQLKPDVVFLDIEMPQVSGLDMLAMLDTDTMPHIVFVTAFEHYALQAFEDNAFDYLLKPVEPSRLNKTLLRLKKAQLDQQDFSSVTPERLSQIPCVGHQRIFFIPQQEIECAYSDLRGVHLVTAQQTSDTQLTLKVLENKTDLVRCHRQYLVRLASIREIKLQDNGLATLSTHSGHSVPVSRRYFRSLKDALGLGLSQ
ncbi:MULTISPECIES: two-component system response regulator BtsR [unclassified Vibrio]|uniref:Two-component system response regulator BtsR n=1 Tax=Vibrio sp. HB236076 TaxID=3232307 RepID=A0AB39HGJ6_9VIBR|nr:two-component system response regulator BtsR [Vibrio sp. HB161653]MDP5254613.1 two-component system response regulator BtsR [Vibrio sp. HB161653]